MADGAGPHKADLPVTVRFRLNRAGTMFRVAQSPLPPQIVEITYAEIGGQRVPRPWWVADMAARTITIYEPMRIMVEPSIPPTAN